MKLSRNPGRSPAHLWENDNLKYRKEQKIGVLPTNGVQIEFVAPPGGGTILISGHNEHGERTRWDGKAAPDSDGVTIGTLTTGFRWKGKVEIWYSDSSGRRHFMTANVPRSSLSDTLSVIPSP
jgi:hypothetical protein